MLDLTEKGCRVRMDQLLTIAEESVYQEPHRYIFDDLALQALLQNIISPHPGANLQFSTMHLSTCYFKSQFYATLYPSIHPTKY